MKVLVIMGSPHKGNTYGAATRIEEEMRSTGDVTFEYLMLRDLDLGHCRGCFTCFFKGEEHCPNKDDAPEVEARMHAADGVLFASPVYGLNVSGIFKTYVDRLSYIFHRPRFFGKKALLLTTEGALGHKEVLRYMGKVARFWGFDVVGGVGLLMPPGQLPKRTADMQQRQISDAARKFYAAMAEGRRSPPGFYDVLVFNAQRASFSELEKESPVDHQYWKEKGWLDSGTRYYTEGYVNPFYHVAGRIAGWYIRRSVKKQRVEKW